MNKTAVHLIAIYISASVCDALLFTIMVTNIPKTDAKPLQMGSVKIFKIFVFSSSSDGFYEQV